MRTNIAKPTTLSVNLDGIPPELKAERRWVAWRLVKRGQKWTKTPLQIANGRNAKSNDQSTWAPFASAASCIARDGIDGIGFMLGGGFAGVDLDCCVDPDTQAIEPWARDILERFSTYAEISPSGTGIKVFCRGSLPNGITGRRKGRIEVYGAGRYFTVTGRPWNGAPAALADCSEALAAMCEELSHGGEETAEPAAKSADSPQASDQEILDLARKAANGAKFSRLWSGDTTGHPTQSEADLALCNLLAFYTGPDPQRVDALFRQSGLFRSKWDERHFSSGRTYGEETIARALDGRTEFYDWSRRRRKNRTKLGGVISRDDSPRITNATIVPDGDGGFQATPMPMDEVIDGIFRATGGWPKRVENSLFAQEGEAVRWLDSTPSLFGWLSHRCGLIQWSRAQGCVTKDETAARLRQAAEEFASVESFPHIPPIPGRYYTWQVAAPGAGETVGRLLEFFCPETPEDRQLFLAALITLAWGGLPGTRPAFMWTAKTGRGRGKTRAAQFSARTFGGHLDISPNEDVGQIKARLLTAEASRYRVALLDNVKTTRFSWGELEALITSDTISGRRLYVGNSNRPNDITWFVTLNGASLSTDLAQRIVEIRLRDPTFDATWDERVAQFIDRNQLDIIADLAGILQRPAQPLPQHSRWACWESQVLARLDNPAGLIGLIHRRRGEVDAEQEEGEILESFFASKLRWLEYDPDTVDVFLPNEIVVRWFNQATGDNCKTTGATRSLRQLRDEGRIQQIVYARVGAKGERGFRWVGRYADSASPTLFDLRHRLKEGQESTR